jgi:hypothetical protein
MLAGGVTAVHGVLVEVEADMHGAQRDELLGRQRRRSHPTGM